MKSGISYFNPAVFRKNLTRFVPAWGLYTLLLVLNVTTIAGLLQEQAPKSILLWVDVIKFQNLVYGFIVARLLFSDLFIPRMCNALHAMPIRREGWFLTNVVSGLVFHLIPSLAAGILATVMLALNPTPDAWMAGPLWFLCTNLQFICFFCLAVFSAFCVGRKGAMLMIYVLVNFGSMLMLMLVNGLYGQLLPGVTIPDEPYELFSPATMILLSPTFEWGSTLEMDILGLVEENKDFTIVMDVGWRYLWIYTAVAIVLALVGLLLYRRRNLESAGDFIAEKTIKPVFLILYTLSVGVYIFGFFSLFAMEDNYIFLAIGLAVGYFTGQMLLNRTTRVFGRKSVLTFCAIALTVGLSVLLMYWDAFGIRNWVPEASRVESVTLSEWRYTDGDDKLVLTAPEDVEKVIGIHRAGLELIEANDMSGEPEDLYDRDDDRYYSEVYLVYRLTDGRTVRRNYYIDSETPAGQEMERLFARPAYVFGVDLPLEELKKYYYTAYEQSNPDLHYTGEDLETLLEAIWLDCEAGTVTQLNNAQGEKIYLRTFCLVSEESKQYVTICAGDQNTILWLQTHG